MNLTEHFTLAEMIASEVAARRGIDNAPPQEVIDDLRKTAQLMERIRTILGVPIIVTSGYRSVDLNMAVGGAPNSAHLSGQAVDFIAPKFGRPFDVCQAIAARSVELRYDQLIHEYGNWTHIGRSDTPRAQNLTIDRSGTKGGISPAHE